MARHDPIGKRFYIPLGKAERISDVAFGSATILSVAVLKVDKVHYQALYDIVQTTFILSVLCMFVMGLVVRLYFAPRSQEGRILDFVSNAFSVALDHQTSISYYNNAEIDQVRKTAANLLENTYFTKSILEKMLGTQRILGGIYVLIWGWALIFRVTDLDWIAVVAQAIFSEQFFSRWLRMEWLRSQVEKIYKDTYNLFRSVSDFQNPEFRARVVAFLLQYEVSKSQAGVSLSTRVFKRLNTKLSAEWNKIKAAAGIA